MDMSDIRGKVISSIQEAGFFVPFDGPDLHLLQDAGLDSFAYVTLLVRIEGIFGIVFHIAQMEECAQLSRLLEVIQQKLEGKARD